MHVHFTYLPAVFRLPLFVAIHLTNIVLAKFLDFRYLTFIIFCIVKLVALFDICVTLQVGLMIAILYKLTYILTEFSCTDCIFISTVVVLEIRF